MVRPLGVVVALPELDRPHVRGDEDGGAEDRVERGGQEGGDGGLYRIIIIIII